MSRAGLKREYAPLMVWLLLIVVIVAALFAQWPRLQQATDATRVKLLTQTLWRSAVSLRQKWELENKPVTSSLKGIRYTFTDKGWPVISHNGRIECDKTWVLLSSRIQPVKYTRIVEKNEVRSIYYNSCYYQLEDGKGVALFYENETIFISNFLTPFQE